VSVVLTTVCDGYVHVVEFSPDWAYAHDHESPERPERRSRCGKLLSRYEKAPILTLAEEFIDCSLEDWFAVAIRWLQHARWVFSESGDLFPEGPWLPIYDRALGRAKILLKGDFENIDLINNTKKHLGRLISSTRSPAEKSVLTGVFVLYDLAKMLHYIHLSSIKKRLRKNYFPQISRIADLCVVSVRNRMLENGLDDQADEEMSRERSWQIEAALAMIEECSD